MCVYICVRVFVSLCVRGPLPVRVSCDKVCVSIESSGVAHRRQAYAQAYAQALAQGKLRIARTLSWEWKMSESELPLSGDPDVLAIAEGARWLPASTFAMALFGIVAFANLVTLLAFIRKRVRSSCLSTCALACTNVCSAPPFP